VVRNINPAKLAAKLGINILPLTGRYINALNQSSG